MAVVSRSDWQEAIDALFIINSTGDIEANEVLARLTDLADSISFAPTSLTAVSRVDDRLVFTPSEGSDVSAVIADLHRIVPAIGSTPGNVVIDNINGFYLLFDPDMDGTITVSAVSDMTDGGVTFFDAAAVPRNNDLILAQANAQFEDGTTTFTLVTRRKYLFGAYLDNPGIPPSPTNPLVYRVISTEYPAIEEVPVDKNNTIFLNPTEGYASDIARPQNRQLPLQILTDAFTYATTNFPSGEHKRIICEEVTSITEFNNDAVGGGNVPNLIFDAPGVTLGNFSSVGHATRAIVRNFDIDVVSDNITISSNDAIICGAVNANAAGPSIQFDSGSALAHFLFKAETVESTVDLDFSSLAANSTGRIEIDRYEGNPITALNTVPDVAIFLSGYIGSLQIYSSANGTVHSATIDNGGSFDITAHNTP